MRAKITEAQEPKTKESQRMKTLFKRQRQSTENGWASKNGIGNNNATFT